MPGKRLEKDKLQALKSAIKTQLEENPRVTAERVYQVIKGDKYFAQAVTASMVSSHLSAIRSQLKNGKVKPEIQKKETSSKATRKPRMSLDKRVQAVFLASKEAEKKLKEYNQAEEVLKVAEKELREALQRSLGSSSYPSLYEEIFEETQNIDQKLVADQTLKEAE